MKKKERVKNTLQSERTIMRDSRYTRSLKCLTELEIPPLGKLSKGGGHSILEFMRLF